MTDKREQILERLEAILGEVAGTDEADAVARNQTMVPEDVRPCFVLFDGGEAQADDAQVGRGRPSTLPSVMEMTPQVNVVVHGHAAEVGPSASDWRGRIVKAVVSDAAIQALAHKGDVRYTGMEQALSNGRKIDNEVSLSFAILYVLKPLDM